MTELEIKYNDFISILSDNMKTQIKKHGNYLNIIEQNIKKKNRILKLKKILEKK